METSKSFIPLAGPRGPVDLVYFQDPPSLTTEDKIRECEDAIRTREEQIGQLMVELEKLRGDRVRLGRVAALEAELKRIQNGGEVAPPPSLPPSPIPEDSGEWYLGALYEEPEPKRSRDEEPEPKRSRDEEPRSKRSRDEEPRSSSEYEVRFYRRDFITPPGLPGQYCTDIIKAKPEFKDGGLLFWSKDRVVGFGYDRNSPDKSSRFWDRLRRNGMGDAKYLHVRQTDVIVKHEGARIPRVICLARDNSHEAQYVVWGQVVYSHEERRGVSAVFDAFPDRRQSTRYFR